MSKDSADIFKPFSEETRDRLAKILQVVLDVEESSRKGEVITCRECSDDLDGTESETCEVSEDGQHDPDQEPYERQEGDGEPETRSIDLVLSVVVPNDGYDYAVDVTGRIEELLSLLLIHPKVSAASTRSGEIIRTGSGYDGDSLNPIHNLA